jgi:hypothetical protein
MRTTTVIAHRAARGPRWHISGTIRADEHDACYAVTADLATAREASYQDRGLYMIQVFAPEQYTDITAEARRIGDALRVARATVADLMQQATAIIPPAHDGGKGIPETHLAAILGLDRMTVRERLGKR